MLARTHTESESIAILLLLFVPDVLYGDPTGPDEARRPGQGGVVAMQLVIEGGVGRPVLLSLVVV